MSDSVLLPQDTSALLPPDTSAPQSLTSLTPAASTGLCPIDAERLMLVRGSNTGHLITGSIPAENIRHGCPVQGSAKALRGIVG